MLPVFYRDTFRVEASSNYTHSSSPTNSKAATANGAKGMGIVNYSMQWICIIWGFHSFSISEFHYLSWLGVECLKAIVVILREMKATHSLQKDHKILCQSRRCSWLATGQRGEVWDKSLMISRSLFICTLPSGWNSTQTNGTRAPVQSRGGLRGFLFLFRVVNEVSVLLTLLSWFSQGILRT